MRKLFTYFLAILIVIMIPRTVYASTTLKFDDSISGEQFFDKVKNCKENKEIEVTIHGNMEQGIANFADKIAKASDIGCAYAKYYTFANYYTFAWHNVSNHQLKLDYTTNDIKEMETGKYEINIDEVTGKEFLEKIHSSKANSKVRLYVTARTKKEADNKLKEFAKDVQKSSKYGLNYAIDTKENRAKLNSYQQNLELTTMIVLNERTKDIKAAEKMVSNIKGWKKMTENQRFLSLTKACQKKSRWKQPCDDFHFYNKMNNLVCNDYAMMYKRVAEMVTNNCESQYIMKEFKDNTSHALLLVRVGKQYYEGNNGTLSKNYKDKEVSFRAWVKENKKEYTKTQLERDFLRVNGYSLIPTGKPVRLSDSL